MIWNVTFNNTDTMTEEKRHDVRYHTQQYFIPEMVDDVKYDILPLGSLYPSDEWCDDLSFECDLEFDELEKEEVWEDFEKIELDEGNMILLYTFPQPEDAPEARYGAVLVNQSVNDLTYYTLELSYGDKWAVCSRDTSMHSCLDFWDSADKDKFVEWVKGRMQ